VLVSILRHADNKGEVRIMNIVKVGILSAVLVAARVLPAPACAALEEETPRPEDAVVVTEESAVIIWDAAKKREHFIREATFKGAAKDIGFIVPSPSTPELKAVNAGAFSTLKKALEPKVEHRTNYEYQWSAFFKSGTDEDTTTANNATSAASDDVIESNSRKTSAVKVQVIQRQSVAGYDATTLKANDVGALNRWLNKNGYVAKADFREWLEPYVENGWVVTAFKVRKQNAKQPKLALAPVRMSFDTGKPFYPYREPSGARRGIATKTPRSLRVFFIGDQRMEGAIGDATKRAWPGQPKWSDSLNDHLNATQRANLAKQLAMKTEQLPARPFMTSFEDFSSPRPGFDEVYFSPSASQETILPEPLVIEKKQRILIPLDLFFLGSVGLFFVGRGWRRRRQGA
jgi:hypothetical protein